MCLEATGEADGVDCLVARSMAAADAILLGNAGRALLGVLALNASPELEVACWTRLSGKPVEVAVVDAFLAWTCAASCWVRCCLLAR